MNRKLTAMLIGTAAAISLVSCGGKNESSARPIVIAESTTTTTTTAAAATASAETSTSATNATKPTVDPSKFHERHDYEDGVLVGQWSGDEADIVLQDNGKVTAEFDISEVMMIKEGVFMLSGEKYPPECLQYDGTTLSVFTNGEEGGEQVEFLTLVRKDEPDTESYDGLYEIKTDSFRQKLAGMIVGEETFDYDVQIRIKRGKFIVRLPEFCDYTQKGDEFSLSLPYSTEGSIADSLGDSTFVLDGDVVTFYDDEGIAEVFRKSN